MMDIYSSSYKGILDTRPGARAPGKYYVVVVSPYMNGIWNLKVVYMIGPVSTSQTFSARIIRMNIHE
jgi:hypothetical protein